MSAQSANRERVLQIIEDAYDEDITDYSGGVPAHHVAEEMGFAEGSIAKYLRPLVESGDLEQVWGIGHDTDRPRRSYVPVEVEE